MPEAIGFKREVFRYGFALGRACDGELLALTTENLLLADVAAAGDFGADGIGAGLPSGFHHATGLGGTDSAVVVTILAVLVRLLGLAAELVGLAALIA